MSYPIHLSQGWSILAEEIDAEIKRARGKFPDPSLLTTALTEEHGEAVRAVLEHYYAVKRERAVCGKRPMTILDEVLAEAKEAALATDRARSDVRKELIQTAAMCVRLALEGDPVHLLTPQGE